MKDKLTLPLKLQVLILYKKGSVVCLEKLKAFLRFEVFDHSSAAKEGKEKSNPARSTLGTPGATSCTVNGPPTF